MKKLNLFAIAMLLISGGVILISACNKEEDEASIIGTWKVTGALFNPAYDPGTGLTTDAYSLMFSQVCSQDDLIMFQDNGVEIEDEGALQCDSTAAQQTTHSYTYTGNTLSIVSSGDTSTITNIAITAATLTGSLSVDFGGGTPVNIDMTLTRQ